MKKSGWLIFGLSAFVLALVGAGVLPPVEAASGTSLDAIGQHGPYAIGFTSYVLTDNSRPAPSGEPGRPIPVYLYYPVDPESISASTPRAQYPLDMLNRPALMWSSEEWEALGYDPAFQACPPSTKGPFPVLLGSGGWTPPAWYMTGIATRLASHGFVVAVPYHVGDPYYFGWEPAPDHYAMVMWNRPRDLSFVLTDLEQRNSAAGDLLHGVIDPSRVAATGWSAGGYAAIALASGDDTVWDYGLTDAYSVYDGPIPDNVPHSPTLPDPRIRAIVTLDGANQELRFDELARVKVPAIGLGEEWNTLLADPNMPGWQARQHAAFSGHPSYRVDISGTNHHSFGDTCNAYILMESRGLPSTMDDWRSGLCNGVVPQEVARAIITRYMIAFLKTNLLGETGYQKMLTPGWALTHETGVEFFVTEKRNPNSIDGEWPGFFIYFPHQPGSEQFRAEKNAALFGHR